MRSRAGYVVALAMLTAYVPGAVAYSLEETESMIGQEERYFQPPDEPAQDVTLRTADDHVVRLAEFRESRGSVFHLYELSGCLLMACRADRGDPVDGEPNSDEGGSTVHHHRHGRMAPGTV